MSKKYTFIALFFASMLFGTTNPFWFNETYEEIDGINFPIEQQRNTIRIYERRSYFPCKYFPLLIKTIKEYKEFTDCEHYQMDGKTHCREIEQTISTNKPKITASIILYPASFLAGYLAWHIYKNGLPNFDFSYLLQYPHRSLADVRTSFGQTKA